MPIYEYECKNCGCVFETIVYTSDTEPPKCDGCGSVEITRRLSCANTIGGSDKSMGSCSPNPTSGFS